MNSALLIVDIQNDFLPGGALGIAKGAEVIPIANKLQHYFSIIVVTQDWHPANHRSFASNNYGHQVGDIIELDGLQQILWPDHCVQHTQGAEFARELHLANEVKIISKGTNPLIDSYSGFFDNGKRQETQLREFLISKSIDTVYLLGLATDYCVKYTAIDSCNLGFKTYVIEDGCRGVNIKPDDSAKALIEMEQAGAIIINSDEVIKTCSRVD